MFYYLFHVSLLFELLHHWATHHQHQQHIPWPQLYLQAYHMRHWNLQQRLSLWPTPRHAHIESSSSSCPFGPTPRHVKPCSNIAPVGLPPDTHTLNPAMAVLPVSLPAWCSYMSPQCLHFLCQSCTCSLQLEHALNSCQTVHCVDWFVLLCGHSR